MNEKILYQYFFDFVERDSLFQKMVEYGAPWDIDIGRSMDLSYITMWSGLKYPSTFLKLNVNEDGIVDTEKVSKILWDIYGKNWVRLWDALNKEYNPIDNYNLEETITRDQTTNRNIDRSGTLSSTVNSDSSSTVDSTENEISDANGNSTLKHGHVVNDTLQINDSTHGFNSSNPVPTALRNQTSNQTNSGNDVTTTTNHSQVESTVHQEIEGNDNTKRDDSTTDITKDDGIENETISRTRIGNVGQNSYQELLRQEFELWKWNFYEQVFSDVDKYLCLSVYGPCAKFSQLN